MNSKCTGCGNFDICRKIQEGTCAACPGSMSFLAEKGCKYGHEDCTYVKDLCDTLNKNITCELKELMASSIPCPRCKGCEVDVTKQYASHLAGLIGGAKLTEVSHKECKRCGLFVDTKL